MHAYPIIHNSRAVGTREQEAGGTAQHTTLIVWSSSSIIKRTNIVDSNALLDTQISRMQELYTAEVMQQQFTYGKCMTT